MYPTISTALNTKLSQVRQVIPIGNGELASGGAMDMFPEKAFCIVTNTKLYTCVGSNFSFLLDLNIQISVMEIFSCNFVTKPMKYNPVSGLSCLLPLTNMPQKLFL